MLWVLTGPTASGKSQLAMDIAAARGLEVLSADSMAVYRRMNIGTAKPTTAERALVPHHGLDLVEPHEQFDTSRWVAEAERVIQETSAAGRGLLVVGGTPLYLMALLFGFFDGPSADPDVRARLGADEDSEPGALHRRLAEIDPTAAARIHPNDRKRLVRALEVFELGGKPISELQQQFAAEPRFPYRAVWLDLPRPRLKERVRLRTRSMLEAGLVEETRAIEAASGFGPTASSAIGYAEVLQLLAGELAADELATRIARSTHRLVRRQETWLRRFPGLRRVSTSTPETTCVLDPLFDDA
ncbi:MAG: tRNA (adenosine(37)-N6)-dimethylallyltransferase MiaA [Planctomycetes bacterium]|jgi:tRNA dimethylallyltransferase|nr:tRNA (adenosine(37)-N6)-dimethylallyltransferase MiaA [Planctomycetota bacterium]MDP6423607.1 tRNA (adenosine(37)-N6)-dimethylallyltransferase MiaA [Planctomycetota bacterium]